MERQNEASLDGKVAIVTGSSRGIGKRAALALARRGARLVVTPRTVQASGSELLGTIGQTVKEIESLGGEAVAGGPHPPHAREHGPNVRTASHRPGALARLLHHT